MTTQTKTKHTATPWRLSQPASVTMPRNKTVISGYSNGWSALATTDQMNTNEHDCEANAEFIVTAVNSFDSLVEALEDAQSYLAATKGYYTNPISTTIEQALSKAKAVR